MPLKGLSFREVTGEFGRLLAFLFFVFPVQSQNYFIFLSSVSAEIIPLCYHLFTSSLFSSSVAHVWHLFALYPALYHHGNKCVKYDDNATDLSFYSHGLNYNYM